tara:strand:+ start:589 stop:1041 length:453 start_codon:yes stop_codon:yes gene_type:complete
MSKLNSKDEVCIIQSKQILKRLGYFSDDLWHIDSLKTKYPDMTDHEAQETLSMVLNNEWIIEKIWTEIDSYIKDSFGYDDVTQAKEYWDASYPYNEGDDYWTIEGGVPVASCWDDESERLHDFNPNKFYFNTEEEAIDFIDETKRKIWTS